MALDFVIVSIPQGMTEKEGSCFGLFSDWSRAWPNCPKDAYYDYSAQRPLRLLKDKKINILSPPEEFQRTCPAQWTETNEILLPINSPADPLALLDGRTLLFEETGSRPDNISISHRRHLARRSLRVLRGVNDRGSSIHDHFTKLFYREESVDRFTEAKLVPSERMGVANSWIGPVILEFSGADVQIPAEFDSNEVSSENLLYRLLDERSVKHVQPLFPWVSDLRWCFFATWWSLLGRNSQLTTVERLIFHPGSSPSVAPKCYPDCPFHAFFVLDMLGGAWKIDGAGTSCPSFKWIPPSNASANSRWLARYWYRRWLGDPTNLSLDPFVVEHRPIRILSRPQLSQVEDVSLNVSGSSTAEILTSLGQEQSHDTLGASFLLLSTLFGASDPRSDEATRVRQQHTATDVAERAKQIRKNPSQSQSGANWYSLVPQQSEFHKLFEQTCISPSAQMSVAKLYRFCRDYLLPLSPIYIALPQFSPRTFGHDTSNKSLRESIEQHNATTSGVCIELVRSRGGGVHAVLNEVATSITTRSEHRRLSEALWVDHGGPWLASWSKALTTHTADFQLLVQKSPPEFRLGYSQLAADSVSKTGLGPRDTCTNKKDISHFHVFT